MTSRIATRRPTATARMSATTTEPRSPGDCSPRTNAVTLGRSTAATHGAATPTADGCRKRLLSLCGIGLMEVKGTWSRYRIVGAMHYPSSELVIDPVLLRKYDVSGPRYTSYPTADRFVEAYGESDLRQWLGKRNIGGISQPLSVYVHLPFCDTLCYYCGCNKVITRDHSRSAKYIKYLQADWALLAPLLEAARRIVQLHWGGGTPTFLTREEMGELWRVLQARFEFSAGCESSIEVDPRRVDAGTMEFLGRLGFNRLSVGVQDFDPEVQKAVHRIQSEDVTRRVIDEARANGFRSVNVDLIYGLPKQTLDSFNRTLDRTLALAPDR